MSYRFTLTGRSSILTSEFDSPIYLEEGEYALGLLSFETYNTIANISEPNNIFQLVGKPPIRIPPGAYEITDIENTLRELLDKEDTVFLRGNSSTSLTSIKATRDVDFRATNSIGDLLGFQRQVYPANHWHIAESVTKIMPINSILISCDITIGSYKNGRADHILHQFFPTVPSGYKIVENPNPVIYLPISTKTAIHNMTVKILDQDDHLVSFNSEIVTVGLHLKKL